MSSSITGVSSSTPPKLKKKVPFFFMKFFIRCLRQWEWWLMEVFFLINGYFSWFLLLFFLLGGFDCFFYTPTIFSGILILTTMLVTLFLIRSFSFPWFNFLAMPWRKMDFPPAKEIKGWNQLFCCKGWIFIYRSSQINKFLLYSELWRKKREWR